MTDKHDCRGIYGAEERMSGKRVPEKKLPNMFEQNERARVGVLPIGRRGVEEVAVDRYDGNSMGGKHAREVAIPKF